jgi:hypothetical protein
MASRALLRGIRQRHTDSKNRTPTRQPGRLPHKSGRLMKSPFVEQASRLLGGWAGFVIPSEWLVTAKPIGRSRKRAEGSVGMPGYRRSSHGFLPALPVGLRRGRPLTRVARSVGMTRRDRLRLRLRIAQLGTGTETETKRAGMNPALTKGIEIFRLSTKECQAVVPKMPFTSMVSSRTLRGGRER